MQPDENTTFLKYEDFSEISLINLPVMNALIDKAIFEGYKDSLSNTAIYYVHHPLQTSINVVDSMMKLGAKPDNIFVLGKSYSECSGVVDFLIKKNINYQFCSKQNGIGNYYYSFIRDINWLWFRLIEQLNKDIEKILILDHGGRAIAYMPLELLDRYKIIGIEKTTAGFIENLKLGKSPIPIIDVANSAAKKYLESPLIAEAVVRKIINYLPREKSNVVFGIVGVGTIGKAIVNYLLANHCQVIIYDIDKKLMDQFCGDEKIICTDNLPSLFAASDFIFGCSGRDITENNLEIFKFSTKNKTLISCSSEDKEFLTLLRFINNKFPKKNNHFSDIEYISDFSAKITILRGGFPANFDKSGESVPAKDIQLTRSLVLAAIIQSCYYFEEGIIENKVYPLDASLQKFVVNEWSKLKQRNSGVNNKVSDFTNERWIYAHSKNIYSKLMNISNEVLSGS